jgi:hypothetical protein
MICFATIRALRGPEGMLRDASRMAAWVSIRARKPLALHFDKVSIRFATQPASSVHRSTISRLGQEDDPERTG